MTEQTKHQFGTFAGVFTPSILTILGAIMFMRANFVMAEAGIIGAVLILLLAKSISILTTLSVSAIATNMQVRGGGAYFMISRVLGPEYGGAIGVVFFIAQALSVPFYILGFTEALVNTFPALEPYFAWVALGSAAALFVVVYIGAGWAIKAQFFIMVVLGLAIVSFLGGALVQFDLATFRANLQPAYTALPTGGGTYSFWSVFAIYFPAVTGLLAGVNMSGDLKDPARSLPRGTMAAVLTGLVVYLAQILLNGGAYARIDLMTKPYMIMVANAFIAAGFLVAAGVIAATLSSALGSYLGAPRILQAVARDRLLGFLHFFGRGTTKGDEPRLALALTGLITLVTLLWAGGDNGGQAFDVVASIITMFFLYTYGMVNLAACVEGLGNNPSFRPRFKFFHWSAALIGAAACGLVAFLIDPLPALVAAVLVGLLYYHLKRRQLSTAFGDARRGFYFSRVRANLLRLQLLKEDPKNWRPTILAFSGNPQSRETLVNYAVWLEAGSGIVLLANVIKGDPLKPTSTHLLARRSLDSFLERSTLPAFPLTIVAEDIPRGVASALYSASIGSIRPNLALMGWTGAGSPLKPFRDYLDLAAQLGMSIVLISPRGLPRPGPRKRIDVWWRGEKNGALMLLLAYLLSSNWEWSGGRIRVLREVGHAAGQAPALAALRELIEHARVEADAEVVLSDRPFAELLCQSSCDADAVFLGFEIPPEDQLAAWHASYVKMLDGMPTTLIVNSRGQTDLTA